MKFKSTLIKSAAVLFIVVLSGCGGKEFKKSPLDNYIVAFGDEKPYTIILADMDVDGTFFKTYKHKYRVIRTKNDLPYEEMSAWVEVGKDYFWKNENNLGMAVLEKNENGDISKVAAPPGYNYVGNNKYGEWRTHRGSSFWAFYGQYMFMSHMFGLGSRPIYRRDYNNYRSGGYYGNRNYYGPKAGSSNMYGTNSAMTRKSNPNFYQRRATKSGWSSSRSRVGGRSRGSGFGK